MSRVEIDYQHPLWLSEAEQKDRATELLNLLQGRRTVRDFSDEPVSRTLIETAIKAAGTAPSGANQQPWTFVAICDPETKSAIRQAAEAEEREFYQGRAGDEWLDALAPLGTDADKPFLEKAPWLIVIFAQRWGEDQNGKKVKHYYVPESVGIASGVLITTLHSLGLSTLTHTPAPMGFLTEICGRPANEKAVILLVVGYASETCKVPAIDRKPIDMIARFIE